MPKHVWALGRSREYIFSASPGSLAPTLRGSPPPAVPPRKADTCLLPLLSSPALSQIFRVHLEMELSVPAGRQARLGKESPGIHALLLQAAPPYSPPSSHSLLLTQFGSLLSSCFAHLPTCTHVYNPCSCPGPTHALTGQLSL